MLNAYDVACVTLCLTNDDLLFWYYSSLITGKKARISNVRSSLCLTKHHAMKTFRGSGSIAPRILNLGARWR
jgi:hypothetical protein